MQERAEKVESFDDQCTLNLVLNCDAIISFSFSHTHERFDRQAGKFNSGKTFNSAK